jgi:DNA-3-methyladenine glycosylase II
MPRHSRGFDTGAAFAHLTKRDRKLGTWMKKLGPIGPDARWRKSFDPVDALARAILYQQLSGKAAATIVGRVEVAIDSNRFHCDTLARIDDVACARAACPATRPWRCAISPPAKRGAKSPTCAA